MENPSEEELQSAVDTFVSHMQFLSDSGTNRFSSNKLESNEHLEGALLEVLVDFIEKRNE